jgi:hypothetical protein
MIFLLLLGLMMGSYFHFSAMHIVPSSKVFSRVYNGKALGIGQD